MPSNDKGNVPLRRPLGVEWWILPILALAAAAYCILWRQAPSVTNDWGGYARVAKDIAKHLLPTALHFRTPGYPILLVLTGSTDTPTRALFVLQLLLYMSSVYLMIGLLRDQGFPIWVRLAVCFLVLLPPFVEPSAYALTESPSAFLLITTVWLVARRGWGRWSALGSGLTAGFAALIRPGYQLLGLVIALALFAMGHRRKALGLALIFSVTVGSLAAYNAVRFGYPSITPATGWNLSTRTTTFLEGWRDERTRGYLVGVRDSMAGVWRSHFPYMYIWHVNKGRLTELTGLEGVALDNYMLSTNLRLIKSDPIGYLSEVGKSLAQIWLPDSNLADFGSKYLFAGWTLLHFTVLGLFLLQLTVALGVALTRRKADVHSSAETGIVYVVATTIIAYTVVASCALDVGFPRYLRPVDLLVVLATTIGMRHWQRLRNAARLEGAIVVPSAG